MLKVFRPIITAIIIAVFVSGTHQAYAALTYARETLKKSTGNSTTNTETGNSVNQPTPSTDVSTGVVSSEDSDNSTANGFTHSFAREKLKGTARTQGDFRTKPQTVSSAAQNSTFTCSLSNGNQTFAGHGGNGSFSVKSGNAGLAVPDVDWITTNVIVQYSVKPNTGSSDRSGTVTVGDKVFTVNQTGTASKAAPAGTSTGKGSTKARYQ